MEGMEGTIINNVTGLVDDAHKLGRSPEIRGMELPGVVKTGLLMIISGIVVGGVMSILWCLGFPPPFTKAKVIGINATFLSILFAIALMIWWFVMNLLVPYRRERWQSWIKWLKLSEEEKIFLSELFKPPYLIYLKEQEGRMLTPKKQERKSPLRWLFRADEWPKEVPGVLYEIITPQALAEWIGKNWKQRKKNPLAEWKKSLYDAKMWLGVELCEMLEGAPPEEKVLVKLIKKNFVILKKSTDRRGPCNIQSFRRTMIEAFRESRKELAEFFMERMLEELECLGFLRKVDIDAGEPQEKDAREITLPAWRLLEHLELRRSLP